jgi:hypothetical protein
MIQRVVEYADVRRIVSTYHILPTNLHAFFEELEIKNIFDILSSFSDSVNIDIILKIDLEPILITDLSIRQSLLGLDYNLGMCNILRCQGKF